MTPTVALQILRRSTLLGGLSEPTLRAIAAIATSVLQPAGSWVFHQGDPSDALYVVSVGAVRVVSTTREGRETTFGSLGPGALFGEIALLDGMSRSAGVVAVSDAVLLRVPRAPFLALVHERVDLSTVLFKLVTGRVRDLSQHVEDSASLDARTRLVRHLLRLGELRGTPGPDGIVIDEHLPQTVLASSLGLSRQTVNRLLRELQSEGLISVSRARIVLTGLGDAPALPPVGSGCNP